MAPKKSSSNSFAAWFDRLVEYKLTALAIPVCGIAVASALLTSAEILTNWPRRFVEYVGAGLLLMSSILFGVAMAILVTRHLKGVPQVSSTKSVRKPRPPGS